MVLDAAVTLVDRDGAAALSMRRLAAELGVEAMSLYNHVEGKQDILDGMAGLLITRMRPWDASDVSDWKAALRSVCVKYRALITAHPQVFAGQAGRPLVAGGDHAAMEHLLALLQGAGFDPGLATDLFLAGSSFARGFALSDIALAHDPGRLPAWNRDRAFDHGLTALIEGFDTLRRQGGGSTED